MEDFGTCLTWGLFPLVERMVLEGDEAGSWPNQ